MSRSINRNEYELVEALNSFYEAPVFHIEKTGTTMADAEQLTAGKGLPGLLPLEVLESGTVLWADYQTTGRGRMSGRTWESAWGESCLFTLILHEKDVSFPPGFFPLLAGLSLQLLVEKDYGLQAGIKWPNDILLEHEGSHRKAAGILCRKSGAWYLLGMGINCNQMGFEGALSDRAVSLRMAAGKKIDIGELLFGVLDACKWVFDAAGQGAGGPALNAEWLQRIERKMFFINERVVIMRGRKPEEERIEARIEGIGPDGELLYKPSDEGEVKRLYAGEIRNFPGMIEALPLSGNNKGHGVH